MRAGAVVTGGENGTLFRAAFDAAGPPARRLGDAVKMGEHAAGGTASPGRQRALPVTYGAQAPAPPP